MEKAPKTDSQAEPVVVRRVEFAGDVLQQIRQHARGSMRAEICGVLIGDFTADVTRITSRIAGEGASQGGAHVTFTQDTWEHIYKVKDAKFPLQSIVGWYHSHPGFGIFLSDYDLFIHENFFNAQHQVAWVFDPHSDEEGCFGWAGTKIEPLAEVCVIRKHRPPAPEQAKGETASRASVAARGASDGAKKNRDTAPRSRRIIVNVVIAVLAFAGGFTFQVYYGAFKPTTSPQSVSPQTPIVTPTPMPSFWGIKFDWPQPRDPRETPKSAEHVTKDIRPGAPPRPAASDGTDKPKPHSPPASPENSPQQQPGASSTKKLEGTGGAEPPAQDSLPGLPKPPTDP